MWTLKLLSTAATAACGPPSWYAVLILPTPWPGMGTHRSRGMESSVACLELGSTLTRIMDCVLMRSTANLESSSEPSSKTVNGWDGVLTGFRFGSAAGPACDDEVAAV